LCTYFFLFDEVFSSTTRLRVFDESATFAAVVGEIVIVGDVAVIVAFGTVVGIKVGLVVGTREGSVVGATAAAEGVMLEIVGVGETSGAVVVVGETVDAGDGDDVGATTS
jgi:hypothetical protein